MKKTAFKYFLAGFFLSILVVLIGYIYLGVWPFGDHTVLIIDSLHQYLPFYTDLHEKLRDGSSLMYSFSGGLGYNFWSTLAYYLASPLNLLIALIPTENVCDFMDFMILLKVGLCGGCFSWYLHRRDRSRVYLPVVFGMAFSLSNFVIGYYFNLMWLDSIAMLPVVMAGIEQITEGKSGRLFGISLFYGLWCNYYIGFMLCIFSCLYFLVRWIAQDRQEITCKNVFRSCVNFAWYALLAGGMAALILVPAFIGLSTSQSMQGNNFPSVIKFYTDLAAMMEQHMAFMKPVNISDNQVGLNAYCGVFTMLLAFLYLFDRRIRIRERLAHLGLCALLLLSFAMNILNYIWHGFHIQNGLPNRFAFIYVAILLVMAYDAVGHIRDYSLIHLAIAFAVPVLFLVWRLMKPQQEVWLYLVSLGLLVLYFIILLVGRFGPGGGRRIFSAILAGVILAELSANGIFAVITNRNVSRGIYIDDQKSFQTMMEEADDDSFFRSEVDRQRMRNVTMYCGGNAMVMFNSTMHESVVNLCDRLGIEARTNKNGYLGVTKLVNDVLGIRYLASPSKKADTMYQFEKFGEDVNLAFYKNDNALSLGFLVNSDILQWGIYDGDPMEVQNRFVELATGHAPIYELDRYIDMETDQNYGIRIPENKQVYLCVESRVSKIELNTPEYNKTFNDYTDHLYPINGTAENDSANFTVTLKSSQSSVQAEVYTCPNDAYQEVIDQLAKNQLTDLTVKDGSVSGSIHADRDGVLLLTVPYDEGWKITVDGRTTEFQRVGEALTGVPLTAGTHKIEMKFTPPGFFPGAILTVICVLLYLLSGILEKRYPEWFSREGRKHREEKNVMDFQFSDKANKMDAGSIFAILNEKKNELQAQGKKIYNLSIGTPDFKPAQHIIDAVSEAAKKPENYKYAVVELPELMDAAQNFFKRRFDLDLDQDEIMTVYGSQEGMAHITWAVCNPGDIVLAPNPGYQIFSVGPELCDAKVWQYPLYAESGFLPDLDAIPEDIRKRAKLMIVSYPGNPTCKLAPDEFYEKLIRFAKENQIFILHDNAYADLVYGRQGGSFLNYEGAKEVGVEFYSLSKTFSYTGARMSFVIGNKELVQKFKALRTQFDYGTFLPVQYGAIAALNGPFDVVLRQCEQYEARNKALCSGLREIGWDVPDSEGTMFVWAPLPKGFTNSEEFVLELMEKSGVICVPGSSFGTLGEGYVRFALVLPPEELREVAASIAASGILNK